MTPYPVEQLVPGQEGADPVPGQYKRLNGMGRGDGPWLPQQECIAFIQFELAKADMQWKRCNLISLTYSNRYTAGWQSESS